VFCAPGNAGTALDVQNVEIARLDRHVLHIQGRAGISRRTEHRRHPRRLFQFPAKSVLTPSLADHQEFQRTAPIPEKIQGSGS